MDYIDFEVEISPGREQSFAVAVLRSPAGEPRGSLQLPFDQRDLELRLLALENALLRSGATHTRRIASPDEAPVQAIGEGLFRALLNDDILSCYDQSQRVAREQRKGLRLKLRIQAPELAALPWEFLYDPREDEYVCLSRRTPVVRYLDPRQPVPPFKVRPPLRVLGMVASPAGLPELDVSTERRRVEESLRELRAAGLMELVWLPKQTWADLQTAIWQGPWHIFHFIGHGGFDTERDEGVLALADESGNKRLLTATELGRLLGDHDPLRLAVLNACEGARPGRRDVFSSSAATLVRRGVPAVVAMQYEISDQAAIQFGTRFYAAVAHGLPVDAALAEARISMSVATRESAEWGTPVLHTNAPDGQLFELTESAPMPIRPAPELASDREAMQRLERQWRQALSYFWTERWDQAAQVLSDIVAQQPQYHDAAAKLEEARRQGRLAQLYAAGSQAYEARAWPQASEHLQAVVTLDPQYRDAAALLEEAGRQQKLTELYAEARELHRAQAWQGVLNILERIRALDASYEDSEGLESTAREALAAEQRQRQYEALSSRGLAHLESGEWAAAIEVFEGLQREYPEHPDSEVLLARARQRLAEQEQHEQQEHARQGEAARQRQLRAAALYDQGKHHFDAAEWQQAVESFEQLQVAFPSYGDIDALLEKARRRLASGEPQAPTAETNQGPEALVQQDASYPGAAAHLDQARAAKEHTEAVGATPEPSSPGGVDRPTMPGAARVPAAPHPVAAGPLSPGERLASSRTLEPSEVPTRPGWVIPAFIVALAGGMVLLFWILAVAASRPTPPSPAPAPTTKPVPTAAPTALPALVPADWQQVLAGFNWASTTPVSESPAGLANRRLENGLLTWLLKAKQPSNLSDRATATPLGDNFAIVAAIRQVVGNERSSYSVTFRRTSAGTQYEAEIYGTNFAIIAKRQDNNYTILKSGLIPSFDVWSVNTLSIKGTGSHYVFQVNNNFRLEVDDDQITGGNPGILVSLVNPDDDGAWEFSRFEVYQP